MLQHKAGEYPNDLDRAVIAKLIDRFEQLGCFKRELASGRAHAGLFVFIARGAFDREAHVAAAVATDDHAALLGQAVDAELGEKQVQETRVIGVLDVVHVELPVAGQHLAVAAKRLDRRFHHPLDLGSDIGTEVSLYRRRGI